MTTLIRTWLLPKNRPLRWLLPVLVLMALLLLQWQVPSWMDRPEAWTIDARFLLRGEETPALPIVLVAADEASFQMLGDLSGENIRTWPRSRWAELVTKIAAGNPRVIGLDVVFDTPCWDQGGDEELATALASAGNVVLAANLEDSAGDDHGSSTFCPPVGTLADAAAGVGIATFPLDADGAIRRLTLLYPWGGSVQPALGLVVATLYSGAPVNVPEADLGADLSLPIRFRGPERTFQTVSLYQVLSGEVDPQLFQDAMVLIGYTTQLEQDRHLTPFAGTDKMPGIELQANAIDTLLSGQWLHRPPTWLPLSLVGLLGLAGLTLINLRRPGTGVVALLVVVTGFLLVGVLLFNSSDLLLPLVAPTLAAVTVGGVALAERMIFAEREKRIMRQRFAGVMSPERLQAVMDNWDDLRQVERRLKEGAVLFADIRGFTHTTETLMRQDRSREMVDFLSAYLDTMTEAIFAEGGVIYRMLGDGLLVLFGLPESLDDYALRSVQAAVRMAQATNSLQTIWPLREEGPFRMGVGINCGLIADAILGHGRRLDYSVFGDAVNTAARIESHCKVADALPLPSTSSVSQAATILISEELYHQLQDKVVVDENIPPFEARGKSEAIKVVRLLGLQSNNLDMPNYSKEES